MRSVVGVLLLGLGVVVRSIQDVEVTQDSNSILIENGFVRARFALAGSAWLSELYGDFKGNGDYGKNLLHLNGLRLERENPDGSVTSGSDSSSVPCQAFVKSVGDCATVLFPEVYDALQKPTVHEKWQFSLCKSDRTLKFTSEGKLLTEASQVQVRAIRHSMYANPFSTTAFFDQGVVQIKSAGETYSHFGSADRMHRFYSLGGSGAIDVLRPEATGGEQDQVVLLNSSPDVNDIDFISGFQEILLGNFSRRDNWVEGSTDVDAVTIGELGVNEWHREWLIAPNNRNFPSATLPPGIVANMDGAQDLEAYLTGIYGSAVPCLCTYPNEVTQGFQVAQIATTLRNADGRGYNHTYNYFDPDNFISLSAILFSGDSYLQDQVRAVIERTGAFMKTENGQLPHHFEGVKPYYVALSGETQTGPNVFWVKTALRYAAVAGDFAWLQSYLPTLRNASSFVFDLIDPDMHLIFAPGSLMIDVFIRNNYTTDSNAMVVGLLRDFASAERLVGDSTRAVQLDELAEQVAEAVNQHLWASDGAGADHFITQLNLDGTTRDFVDYDANLIAVAHGIPNEDRSRLVQQRVDSGQCSAASGAGPQFVSEVYYGPDDTTNGNTGDSWCAMGRIGYFDALGRKRFRSADDLKYFNDVLLAPVQKDVINYTWMHERYGCDGLQQENRTMYYFEYPSLVAMLEREVRYGVDLTLDSVHIAPFGAPEKFDFHTGNVNVHYDPSDTSVLTVPGEGMFPYVLDGMRAASTYRISTVQSCPTKNFKIDAISGEDGVLKFSAPRGPGCAISISLVQNI